MFALDHSSGYATPTRLEASHTRGVMMQGMLQPQNHVLFTQGDIAFLKHFVLATSSVKFRELNLVQQVAGAKWPKTLRCTSLKLSRHTHRVMLKEHVLVTWTCYIFVCGCARNVTVAATYPTGTSLLPVPLYAQYMNFSLQHGAAT